MTFDTLAPHYWWIERLAFGDNLHRCRVALLPRVTDCRRVLILGEGDGRFLAAFLAACPTATADVIDVSPRMASLARRRVGNTDRVRFIVADARTISLPDHDYDLIVTNFFLDCFPPAELAALIDKLAAVLCPGGRWIVGDFRQLPQRRAAVKLAIMYAFFRLTTRLPATSLTDPSPLLSRRFTRLASRSWQGGFLSAELWQRVTALASHAPR